MRTRTLLPVLLPLALGLWACGGAESQVQTGEEQDLGQVTPLGPDPRGEPTKYPIVLAHGFNASPTKGGFNTQIIEALRADGHRVHIAQVPPYDSVAVRAQELAKHIDAALAEFGTKKVNLIAHSMGGLDSREVISVLGYGDRVASLTTMSTPHRGSGAADEMLKLLSGVSDASLDAFATAWGLNYNDLADDSHLRAAFEALAEANADAFEAAHPDDPGVYYQSWAGVSGVGGIPNPHDREACDDKLIEHTWRTDVMGSQYVPVVAFVEHGTQLRSADGVVTVASAHHGEFRGCMPADHTDMVGGKKGDPAFDKHTGYDYVRFYRNIAYDLSEMGF